MKHGETIKIWSVMLDGKEHAFRFEHQFWTGEKKYYVDGELIKHVAGGVMPSASFASDVPFTIGAHQGKFQFRAVGRVAFYDLIVDGNKIEGEEKSALRAPIWVIVLLMSGLFALAWFSMQ